MVESNWTTLLPVQTQDQFSKCGFYRYDFQPYATGPRSQHRIVFLVLNTNLYYKTDYAGDSDPCGQLKWLDDQLKNATSDPNNRIFITGHVPPGFFERDSSFGPFMQNNGGDSRINGRFVEIVNRYQKDPKKGRIVAQVYGHTHTDSFRIFKDNQEPLSVAFVGASVTPLVNDALSANPSVRLYHYDVSNPYLSDYEQFYMDLKEANDKAAIVWRPLYNFTDVYNVPDLSVYSLVSTHEQLKSSDGSAMDKFLYYNTAGKDSPDCKCFSIV